MGATDEAGGGVDIEKRGTEVSVPSTSDGSEGCWGEGGDPGQPSLSYGMSEQSPGLRRVSGRGIGAGRLGARGKVREGCSRGSLSVASLPWSAHSSHSSALHRICITSLDVTSIQQ